VALIPCLKCGKLGRDGSYCRVHAPVKRPSPSARNRPTPTARKRAKQAAGNRCEDCGREPTPSNPLEVDAVVPVADGGTHDPSNCRVRCRRCHQRKTTRDARRRSGRTSAA
jgi:5-methylcytosine-specific restriction endonuclease McrA